MDKLEEAKTEKQKLELTILQLIQIYEYHYSPVTNIEIQRVVDGNGDYSTVGIKLTVEI